MAQVYRKHPARRKGAVGPGPNVLNIVMNVVADHPAAYDAVREELRKYKDTQLRRLCQRCGEELGDDLVG